MAAKIYKIKISWGQPGSPFYNNGPVFTLAVLDEIWMEKHKKEEIENSLASIKAYLPSDQASMEYKHVSTVDPIKGAPFRIEELLGMKGFIKVSKANSIFEYDAREHVAGSKSIIVDCASDMHLLSKLIWKECVTEKLTVTNVVDRQLPGPRTTWGSDDPKWWENEPGSNDPKWWQNGPF